MWTYSVCCFIAAFIAAILDLDGIGSPVVQIWMALGVMLLIPSLISLAFSKREQLPVRAMKPANFA